MRLNSYPEKKKKKQSNEHYYLIVNQKNSKNLETPKLFIPYEKGIAEKLKRVANSYGLEVIFTRSLSLNSKLPTNPFKTCSKCGVIYKITCSCYKKYIGETRRIIEAWLKEHQTDVINEYFRKVAGLSSARKWTIT